MGKLLALLAAIFNSSIGLFSNQLYILKLQSIEIAFYRCFFALLLLSTPLLLKKYRLKYFSVTKKQLFQYALLSLLGIFFMYTFETLSIKYIPISLVSFLMYASGVFTILLCCIFLKERFDRKKLFSILFVLLGIFIMFISNLRLSGNVLGLFLALIAGLGYSLFIFFMKKFKIESSLTTLFYLFLFGSLYLSIPLLRESSYHLRPAHFPYLFALAIIPTIGGFYCTNKAISLLEASKVQLIEMTEPFFASILGFIILKQTLTIYDVIADLLIFIGLIILETDNIRSVFKKSERTLFKK